MCVCYILYSKTLDRFYVGYTCDDLLSRVTRHNQYHKGYTGKTNDWVVVYHEEFGEKKDAMAREKQIKSWKSRKAIVEFIQTYNGDTE